jgi:hypothetical protein
VTSDCFPEINGFGTQQQYTKIFDIEIKISPFGLNRTWRAPLRAEVYGMLFCP